MRMINGLYNVEVLDRNEKVGDLIIIRNSTKDDKTTICKVLNAPENGFYKSGDTVICHKMFVKPNNGTFIIEESGIIAKYNSGKNIEDVTINKNYVLIKITADNSVIDLAGEDFYIDTTWQEQVHAPTFGKIVKTPENMVFNNKKKESGAWKDPYSLPFDTDCDVIVGDTVHFHYNSIFNAENYGLVFKENGSDYMFIEYSQLFIAVRDEDVIMLNGYMAVEIPDDEIDGSVKNGVILVDIRDKDKQKHWGQGVIRYKGKPNKDYMDWSGVDERDYNIKVGDHIFFRKTKMSKFGQDIHIKNDKIKGLYRVQVKDVLCQIN